jgi:hypothetical protein
MAPLPDEEALLVVAAGAPGTVAGEGIAASAPASACSRRASALDAGSAADCFAAGWLGPSASDAWDVAAEASVAPVPSAGVAASVWASAAEKSLFSDASAELPDAADWVSPGLDALAAPDPCVVERADCRPLLLGALDREEARLAGPEPDADEPSAAGCALRDAAEFAPAELESAVPEPDAAAEDELAGLGVPPDDVGAEEAGPVGAGIDGSVSTGSAATSGGPAGPKLL